MIKWVGESSLKTAPVSHTSSLERFIFREFDYILENVGQFCKGLNFVALNAVRKTTMDFVYLQGIDGLIDIYAVVLLHLST